MYGLSEFDGFWVYNLETVQEYRLAFPASPRIECGIVPMAPYCIELSFQCCPGVSGSLGNAPFRTGFWILHTTEAPQSIEPLTSSKSYLAFFENTRS